LVSSAASPCPLLSSIPKKAQNIQIVFFTGVLSDVM
jgi:hypothetical protein